MSKSGNQERIIAIDLKSKPKRESRRTTRASDFYFM